MRQCFAVPLSSNRGDFKTGAVRPHGAARVSSKSRPSPAPRHYNIGEEKTMIVNTTPHPITFRNEDGTEFTVAPSGVIINAKPVEEEAGERAGAKLVRTKFVTEPASEVAIAKLEAENPDGIIVGSLIAAQAYPGRVLGMTPAAGFERVPVEQKRMNPRKFTTY